MTSDFLILMLRRSSWSLDRSRSHSGRQRAGWPSRAVSVGSLASIDGLASLKQTRGPSTWRTMALIGMVVVFLAVIALAANAHMMQDDDGDEDNDQARVGFAQVTFS